MKRKKRGNSLIVTVTTCMFVTVVSAAMLSMVAGNYKARISESQRVQNLYSSDSGIDIAYNIISKTFDGAAKYGKLQMEALENGNVDNKSPNKEKYQDIQADITNLKNDINYLENQKSDADEEGKFELDKQIAKDKLLIEDDEKILEILLNEEFKRGFRNFIKEPQTSEQDALGNDEGAPDKLQNSIENHKFVSKINNINNFEEETIRFNNRNSEPTLKAEVSAVKNVDESTNIVNGIKKSEGHYYEVEFTVYGKQFYDIAVNSTFKSSGNTNVTGENLRELQANYKMFVPNYKDIYYEETSGDLHEYLALNDRALTIGGDMSVNGADNLRVNGNVFAQGVEHQTTLNNRTIEKYHGGIILANSNNVTFNDDVITRNTFNVRNGVKDGAVNGDLYARNAYVGGYYYDNNENTGLDEDANNSNLNINKGLILDNDLAMKAKDCEIKIYDFYGINDKNISSDGTEISGIDKVKNSSSIIINGSENSSVDISNSAYIMGTAHIDTKGNNEGYQTGESGAVKGNYIAYSARLDNAEQLDYYEPLQLLKDSNVFNKADHFKKYWDPDLNPGDTKVTDESAKTGGITWPSKDGSINSDDIWTTGAIVYQEGENKPKVIKSHYSPKLEAENGTVYDVRKDFASKVYKFGQTADINDYNNSNITSFNSLMDLTGISDLEGEKTDQGEYAIVNGDAGKEIKIVKSTDDKTSITNDSDGNIYIKVANENGQGNLNGVIATAGNVSIEDDNIKFTGSIVAKGNLKITGKSVEINYDKDIIDRVQEKNYELFEKVFGVAMLDTQKSSSSTEGDTRVIYDLKNFLENKLWKIIK